MSVLGGTLNYFFLWFFISKIRNGVRRVAAGVALTAECVPVTRLNSFMPFFVSIITMDEFGFCFFFPIFDFLFFLSKSRRRPPS